MSISGAVNSPKKIIFYPGLKYKDAILQSGGYAANALKRRGYVIYQNGEISAIRNFLFFRKYPKLKRGCEILVVQKGKGLSTAELIGITSGLISALSIILTVLIYFKQIQ